MNVVSKGKDQSNDSGQSYGKGRAQPLQPAINITVRLKSRLEARLLPALANTDRDVARQNAAVVASTENCKLSIGRRAVQGKGTG